MFLSLSSLAPGSAALGVPEDSEKMMGGRERTKGVGSGNPPPLPRIPQQQPCLSSFPSRTSMQLLSWSVPPLPPSHPPFFTSYLRWKEISRMFTRPPDFSLNQAAPLLSFLHLSLFPLFFLFFFSSIPSSSVSSSSCLLLCPAPSMGSGEPAGQRIRREEGLAEADRRCRGSAPGGLPAEPR